jgi:hypothetical protein
MCRIWLDNGRLDSSNPAFRAKADIPNHAKGIRECQWNREPNPVLLTCKLFQA